MAEKKIGERIDIGMGTGMMLDIEGVDGKVKSRLVGLVPSEFIIVTAPIGHAGIREKLFGGNKLTLRYIFAGKVYGFETEIIAMITKPKSMLVIHYPSTFMTASLRKSERYDCYIPCKMKIDNTDYEGTIMDFSTSGVRCLIPGLSEKIQRDIASDGVDGVLIFDAPNDKKSLDISVTIVNQTEYKSASKVGVAFDAFDDDVQVRVDKLAEFLERK